MSDASKKAPKTPKALGASKKTTPAAETGLFALLKRAGKTPAQQRWQGTFEQFLRLFEKGSEFKNLGVLAHCRVYNMIIGAGVESKDHFGNKRRSYNFFEDDLFGIEESINDIMSYIHSAAQKTETSRRLLLLFGPPSSGKSEIVNLLKRGLERYTRTDDGAIFALQGSKMHENPFLLVPDEYRKKFEEQYGLRIEGRPSPHTQYRLEHEFKGDFMQFPVERIFLSEASRRGIGTWLPSDTKSQDISELVGSIDLAKIAEIGDEADPRAYNFDGELNVANRGIMEFIEGLKADEKFLRNNLTATQEKAIKAPRFGLIYVDTFIIMHTNESEFIEFMAESKYEAYHDRMVIVRIPYNLSVDNEVKIYEKLLANSDIGKDMHVSPLSLETAATFAVLSRLEPPKDSDLTPIKKMRLYNSEEVRGFKTNQVPDLKKKSPREGMSGVSPRFIIDQISASMSRAKDEERTFVTAIDILRQLNRGVRGRDTFKDDEKNRYEEYIDLAKNEYNDMLRNDIQKAFFLSFPNEAKALFENYLDNIHALASNDKLRDPVTNELCDPDEKLIDAVEGHINISDSGKEDFRNEIIRLISTAARKGKTFNYTQHAGLREAIEKQLFEERKSAIRMTVSTRNPDPEAMRKFNEVIDRMADKQGYTPEAANELLKYASAHLFDK